MSESLAISWTAARCISSSLDTLSLEDKDFSHCCTLSILKNFILVSSWLKMLYQHQVYSEVIHWYIYMCLFSFNFFSPQSDLFLQYIYNYPCLFELSIQNDYIQKWENNFGYYLQTLNFSISQVHEEYQRKGKTWEIV